jgi:phage terminase small subunit
MTFHTWTLTPKQQCFVDEYLIDLNATQAAIRAGYSAKTAKAIGAENLTKPDIKAAIDAAMKDREARTEINQDAVLSDLDEVKRDAMAKVADRDGNMTMKSHTAALKALELQGKHLGMFKDRTELTGKDGAPLIPTKLDDMTDAQLEAIAAGASPAELSGMAQAWAHIGKAEFKAFMNAIPKEQARALGDFIMNQGRTVELDGHIYDLDA